MHLGEAHGNSWAHPKILSIYPWGSSREAHSQELAWRHISKDQPTPLSGLLATKLWESAKRKVGKNVYPKKRRNSARDLIHWVKKLNAKEEGEKGEEIQVVVVLCNQNSRHKPGNSKVTVPTATVIWPFSICSFGQCQTQSNLPCSALIHQPTHCHHIPAAPCWTLYIPGIWSPAVLELTWAAQATRYWALCHAIQAPILLDKASLWVHIY